MPPSPPLSRHWQGQGIFRPLCSPRVLCTTSMRAGRGQGEQNEGKWRLGGGGGKGENFWKKKKTQNQLYTDEKYKFVAEQSRPQHQITGNSPHLESTGVTFEIRGAWT